MVFEDGNNTVLRREVTQTLGQDDLVDEPDEALPLPLQTSQRLGGLGRLLSQTPIAHGERAIGSRSANAS